MRGEDGLGGVVVEVVRHVGEVRALWLEKFDEADGVVEVRVAGVRVAAEGVEDEDVETLQESDAFGGQVAHVGYVGGGAETVAGDYLAAVDDGDALEVRAEDGGVGVGLGGEQVQLDAGAGGVAIDGAEGVVEDAADDGGGGLVGKEREVCGVFEGEGAKVVHAEDMVGVVVGVEDGVDAREVLAEGLRVEVWAGIDQHSMGAVLQADRRTSPAIL